MFKRPRPSWVRFLFPSLCVRRHLAVTAVTAALAGAPASAGAEPLPDHATTGFRLGEDTVEGFADFLIPLHEGRGSMLLLNPRFSLRDGGENEGNIGLVWRHLFSEHKLIVGANAYFDSRQSQYGNRFNQVGYGLEVLSEWLDARINWYDVHSDPELINEYETERVATRTQVSRSSSVTEEADFGDPFATGHRILQDIETTTITRTTVTTARTTTTTNRVFQEFEAGLDGYDAEIGVRLPLPEGAPVVRLFAGKYDFTGEFGREIEGNKGRLEVRAGPYLTFDAEVFEDDELNGTDYFVGFRLQIPLHGKDTWKRFKAGFTRQGQRPFAERRHTDMVMRDVRVQMEESDPIEDANRFRQKIEVDVDTDTSTETETKSGKKTVQDDITFVDGDNTSAGDGSYEDPKDTLSGGVDTAGEDGVIFVQEKTGSGGTYDEKVKLKNGQTITSSVQGFGGRSFSTANKPKITYSNDHPLEGVINLASGNTVNRLHVTARNCTGCWGINNSGSSAPTVIRNNTIKTEGIGGHGVYNWRNSDTSAVSGNTITTSGVLGYGVVNGLNTAASTVSGNTINTLGTNGWGVLNAFNDAASTVSGNAINTSGRTGIGVYNLSNTAASTVSGNTINTLGAIGYGVYNQDNTAASTVSGNTIDTTGIGADGLRIYRDANTDVSNNTVTGTGGDTVYVENSKVSGSGNTAAPFSCDDAGGNTGQISFNGGTRTCPP